MNNGHLKKYLTTAGLTNALSLPSYTPIAQRLERGVLGADAVLIEGGVHTPLFAVDRLVELRKQVEKPLPKTKE